MFNLAQSKPLLILSLLLAGAAAGLYRSSSLRVSQPETASLLRTVADVPLPGAAVRFDYQSYDASQGRLYIAHMSDDHLVVFDVGKREVVANLDGFANLHGVICVPEENRIYASVTGDHEVAVVDRGSLKTLARVGRIKYPDGLAYAPTVHRVFVSDEHGDVDAVIDTLTNKMIASIPLAGGAGNTVYDQGADKVYVSVHGKNDLVTIDPAQAKIVARTPLPGIENPHGIALDVENRLAFVAGEGNSKLAVVDLNTMQLLATFPVGRDPDVLAFDPGVGRLYVAAESGNITIFHESNRTLVRDGGLELPHAHTVSVDPVTHLVYFPLQNIAGKPLLRIMEWAPGKK